MIINKKRIRNIEKYISEIEKVKFIGTELSQFNIEIASKYGFRLDTEYGNVILPKDLRSIN